jgi:hypothetical protein
MSINMPAKSILLAWMVALGVCMWRRSAPFLHFQTIRGHQTQLLSLRRIKTREESSPCFWDFFRTEEHPANLHIHRTIEIQGAVYAL